jgi:hypothetical protein
MAQPARRIDPPVDPTAVKRAYRLERAKRRAREQRQRELRLATLRFLLVLVLLTAAFVALASTVWHEVERLFGF